MRNKIRGFEYVDVFGLLTQTASTTTIRHKILQKNHGRVFDRLLAAELLIPKATNDNRFTENPIYEVNMWFLTDIAKETPTDVLIQILNRNAAKVNFGKRTNITITVIRNVLINRRVYWKSGK